MIEAFKKFRLRIKVLISFVLLMILFVLFLRFWVYQGHSRFYFKDLGDGSMDGWLSGLRERAGARQVCIAAHEFLKEELDPYEVSFPSCERQIGDKGFIDPKLRVRRLDKLGELFVVETYAVLMDPGEEAPERSYYLELKFDGMESWELINLVRRNK